MTFLSTPEGFFRAGGLPEAACVPAPRPIEAVHQSTSRLLAKGHTVLTGALVKLEAQGELPAPLAKEERYEGVPIDLDLFSLKYVDGVNAGDPVVFTSSGALPITYRVDPRPAIVQALLSAKTMVQDHLTGHSEVEEAPEVVQQVQAILTAYHLVFAKALFSGPAIDRLKDALANRMEWAQLQLQRWLAGRPVAGLKDKTPAIAESGAVAKLLSAPVSWSDWGCGL